MAKFALVGYGSDGRGLGKTTEGYTYVVSDNVRTGTVLQPVATSRSGKKFVTTGVARHTFKENSVLGQNAKQQAMSNGVQDLTNVYTGKELGVSGSRAYPKEQKANEYVPSQYAEQTRAGNLAMQMLKTPDAKLTKNAEKTYDEYAKQFMNKENNNEQL